MSIVCVRTRNLIIAASGVALIAIVTLGLEARRATRGLRAELIVSNADIGIPGISKMYGARLFNRSLWPIHVSRCDYVDDTMTPGKMVAYAVQRWDEKANQWTTVVESSVSDFCKPYPLGILRAKATTGFLWPGQSLSTGEEATAARGTFNLGDKGRFVIFVGAPGDYSRTLSTPEFVIDQHPETDISLRIRH